MNFDGAAFAHCVDALVGLPLDIDLRTGTSQQGGEVLAHLIPPRPDLRLLANNCDINVSEQKPPRGNPPNGLLQKYRTVLTIVAGVRVRKELPDIRLSDSPQQGIRHRMENRVAVRVTDRARRMVKSDSPQNARPTTALWLEGLEAMQIVTVPNPA